MRAKIAATQTRASGPLTEGDLEHVGGRPMSKRRCRRLMVGRRGWASGGGRGSAPGSARSARGYGGSTPTSSAGSPTGPTGSGTTGPSSISWSMPRTRSATSRARGRRCALAGTSWWAPSPRTDPRPAPSSRSPTTARGTSPTPSAPGSPSSAPVATSTAPQGDRCSPSRGWRCGGGSREGRPFHTSLGSPGEGQRNDPGTTASDPIGQSVRHG
jgi:hypothetical protein